MFTRSSLCELATVFAMAVFANVPAAFADDDSNENDDMMQMMPLGSGLYGGGMGGYFLFARPIDTDNDGLISASEASLHASENFAVFDGDGDNMISEDEYLDNAPTKSLASGRRNTERLFANRVARFKTLDTDADGNVSLAEFIANSEASFGAADINGDGKVTVWEFRAQQNPF